MNQRNKNNISLLPWKNFIILTIESLLAFYIATFCLIMFYVHRGINWVPTGIFLGLLYLFVVYACGKRIFSQLSLAAVMLLTPIVPLIALIIVVTMIPLLEWFY